VRSEFVSRTNDPDAFPDPPEFLWLSPDQVTTTALEDARRGRAQSIAGVGYRVGGALLASLPRGLNRRLSAFAAKHA
jgi:hypothetical protein